MKSSEHEGLLLGLLGVVIFGLTLPATRVAITQLDPIFVGIGRAVVAAMVAAIILAATRQPWPPRRLWTPIIFTSAGVVLGFPLLATLAMQYVPASHGGVILAVLPLATALAAMLFAGERPTGMFWLWAVAGSLAVVAFALMKAGGIHFELADILLLGAVISAAIGYAIGGKLSRELGGWQVICWALVFGAPFMLVIVLIWAGPINWSASFPVWGSFAYVALFSQLLGFFAWNRGMALGGVARVGQLQLLQPFVTLAAAAFLLFEPVGALEIGFAILVVLLVALGRGAKY